MLEPLFELASCEGDGGGSFYLRRPVRLVQGDNEILNVPRDRLNQYEFFSC
jgi:hypothetical protein